MVVEVRPEVIISSWLPLMTTFTVTSCDYYLIRWLLSLSPNTPPQVEASPISVRCLLCFRHARALVSTLAVCSGSRQLSIFTRFCSMSSLTQCHQIAICLLWLWNCWFLAIRIEPSLPPFMSVGCSSGYPSSSKRLRNQQAWHAASDKATYIFCLSWWEGYRHLILGFPGNCSPCC